MTAWTVTDNSQLIDSLVYNDKLLQYFCRSLEHFSDMTSVCLYVSLILLSSELYFRALVITVTTPI